jgi:hypothetical protein
MDSKKPPADQQGRPGCNTVPGKPYALQAHGVTTASAQLIIVCTTGRQCPFKRHGVRSEEDPVHAMRPHVSTLPAGGLRNLQRSRCSRLPAFSQSLIPTAQDPPSQDPDPRKRRGYAAQRPPRYPSSMLDRSVCDSAAALPPHSPIIPRCDWPLS